MASRTSYSGIPSLEERRLRGIELCRRLRAAINAIAVAGMRLWDQTWAIVAGADADFMIALFDWERSGSGQDSDRVAEAYDAVTAAWRMAVSAFQARCSEEGGG